MKTRSPHILHNLASPFSFTTTFYFSSNVLVQVILSEGVTSNSCWQVVGELADCEQVNAFVSQYITGKVNLILPFAYQPPSSLFQHQVLQELQKIPFGKTESYASLAGRLNLKNHARAVAKALSSNQLPLVFPCHRVICSDGSLSGFRFGTKIKQELLDYEKANKII